MQAPIGINKIPSLIIVVLVLILLAGVVSRPPFAPSKAQAATDSLSCVKGKNGIGGGGCTGTVTLKLKSGGVIASSTGFGLRVNTTSSGLNTAALYAVQGSGSNISSPLFFVAGVRGDANDRIGVLGTADSGTGVEGYSTSGTGVSGEGKFADGVSGLALGQGAGVHAENASASGIALDIAKGGIKVANAGVGTSTPVFIHKAITGVGGNICSIQNYATVVSNPLADGHSGAILIITPNFGPNNTGVAPAVSPMAVYYDATNQCGKGAGHWVIYSLNTTAIPNNAPFNVLIVQP